MDDIDFSLLLLIYGIVGAAVLGFAWYWYRGNQNSVDRSLAWLLQHQFTITHQGQATTPVKTIFPIPDFSPDLMAEGKLGDHQVRFLFGMVLYPSGLKPVMTIEARLTAPMNGTVLVRPSDVSWHGKLSHVQLEEVMMKKYIRVLANPKQLATGLMSPDFMAWYIDHPPRPAVYVHNQDCAITYQTFLSVKQLEYLAANIPTIIRYIERSGALEKKTQKG